MNKLRLITLNLHCLEEHNIEDKQKFICDEIIRKEVDIILLQEVAQFSDSKILFENIKESNYGYKLQQLLHLKGHEYFYYFETIKHSFGKYDEGVAILSKYELNDVQGNFISKSNDYDFWRTRKMIKGELVLPNQTISIVSSHLGWTDKYEVFEDQVDRVLSHLDNNQLIIMAGDFNVSPKTKEYSYLINSGLKDLYGSSPKYVFDSTHVSDMDLHVGETRIDYFFSNQNLEVLKREMLFKENRVSDHNGVYIELKI